MTSCKQSRCRKVTGLEGFATASLGGAVSAREPTQSPPSPRLELAHQLRALLLRNISVYQRQVGHVARPVALAESALGRCGRAQHLLVLVEEDEHALEYRRRLADMVKAQRVRLRAREVPQSLLGQRPGSEECVPADQAHTCVPYSGFNS